MVFYFENKRLVLKFSNKNKGKFRFKQKRNSKWSDSFATKENKFNKNVYLEWQIGYDTVISDIDKKSTILNNKSFEFTGANGKKKYPYELSEFLWTLTKEKILSVKIFQKLQSEIQKYNDFLNTPPAMENTGSVVINSLEFIKSWTKLPTYYHNHIDGTWTEIIMQKQQYASGVQSMIYFCIPIKRFSNGNQMIGFTSTEKHEDLEYYIDRHNAGNILNVFKALAMASPAHKQDVLTILTVLERNAR